jgi:hypothetical protein
MIEQETWASVRGLESLYEVSSLGRVRSLGRFMVRSDGRKRTIRPRILSASYDARGYASVGLTNLSGEITTIRVHRVVADAFLGIPTGMVVDHINGDRSDNRLSNLRVCSSMNNLTFRNTEKTFKSKHPNIYWDPSRQRFRAAYQYNKNPIRVGDFKTIDEAISAITAHKCSLGLLP